MKTAAMLLKDICTSIVVDINLLALSQGDGIDSLSSYNTGNTHAHKLRQELIQHSDARSVPPVSHHLTNANTLDLEAESGERGTRNYGRRSVGTDETS